MKKLQNNFTTPEQAYKLIRLGMNKSTADCWRQSPTSDIFVRCSEELRPDFFEGTTFIPCWSAGRLIEIFAKCKMYSYEDRTIPLQLYADEINGGLIEFLVDIIYNYNDLDFSKLNE